MKGEHTVPIDSRPLIPRKLVYFGGIVMGSIAFLAWDLSSLWTINRSRQNLLKICQGGRPFADVMYKAEQLGMKVHVTKNPEFALVELSPRTTFFRYLIAYPLVRADVAFAKDFWDFADRFMIVRLDSQQQILYCE